MINLMAFFRLRLLQEQRSDMQYYRLHLRSLPFLNDDLFSISIYRESSSANPLYFEGGSHG